jgi:hypothetical protein
LKYDQLLLIFAYSSYVRPYVVVRAAAEAEEAPAPTEEAVEAEAPAPAEEEVAAEAPEAETPAEAPAAEAPAAEAPAPAEEAAVGGGCG